MLKGLREVEESLLKQNISFFLLKGSPEESIVNFVKKVKAGAVVTDFDPLPLKRRWKTDAARSLEVPLLEVDAHNIIPCWLASNKQEFAAYTFRPKVKRLLDEYLKPLPKLKKHPHIWPSAVSQIDWDHTMTSFKTDRNVPEVTWIKPGERAAIRALNRFIKTGLKDYARRRNDPTQNGQSGLSPYLHFGQLSAQRVALAVSGSDAPKADREAFLEELIVRRELSDNFCYSNRNFDNPKGFPEWARKTLSAHRKDKREYLYSTDDFDRARTHDPLWNAAQQEMVKTGKMHGYMRMYWAKKILEWSATPEEAMRTAIYLNDRYSLDGRDPNGYTGIAWSIGGVHDRAWGERPVFGKIRYMSYQGARSKFDVEHYINKIEKL